MYRLSLSLLLALNCNALSAMEQQAAQMLSQLRAMMEPLKEGLKVAVAQAQQDEVDAKSITDYCESTVKLKKQLLVTVQAYQEYLAKPKDDDKTYETNATALKSSTNEHFVHYLSRPARTRVYLAHPESFAFGETVDKVKGLVDKAETKHAGENSYDKLVLNDLLLSTQVNGLQKMLAAVREQSKAK